MCDQNKINELNATINELEDLNNMLNDLCNEESLKTQALDFAIKAASGTLFVSEEGATLIVSAAEKFLAFLKSPLRQNL